MVPTTNSSLCMENLNSEPKLGSQVPLKNWKKIWVKNLKKKMVKRAQCKNLRIFLPLSLYVKSVLGESEISKSAILTHFKGMNFDIGQFLHISSGWNFPKSRFWAYAIVIKVVFWDILICQYWFHVAVEFLNSHNVKWEYLTIWIICGHFCHFWTFWPFLSIIVVLSHFRPFLAYFDHLWHYWAILDHFWPFLTCGRNLCVRFQGNLLIQPSCRYPKWDKDSPRWSWGV